MIRAVLIDDEAPARHDLRMLLAVHPEIAVVGEAATIRAARELLRTADYDVAFLDVQLMGGTGFDLVPDLRAGAEAIFVTAHNEHAIRAFEVNALDYLLKPVKPARLAESVRRLARRATESAPSAPAMEVEANGESRPVQTLRLEDVVYLNSGSHARFAPVADISAIVAQENYTLVRLADSGQMLVRRSLKAWEDLLPAQNFVRVHRTVLVNLTRIARYEREGPKSVLLYLSGVPEPVGVSRRAWGELRARLAEHFPAA